MPPPEDLKFDVRTLQAIDEALAGIHRAIKDRGFEHVTLQVRCDGRVYIGGEPSYALPPDSPLKREKKWFIEADVGADPFRLPSIAYLDEQLTRGKRI